MNGTWAHNERLDNWHLIVDENIIRVDDGDKTEVEYIAWCGLTFNEKDPRKEGALIDQWGDIIHDECYRKSLET